MKTTHVVNDIMLASNTVPTNMNVLNSIPWIGDPPTFGQTTIVGPHQYHDIYPNFPGYPSYPTDAHPYTWPTTSIVLYPTTPVAMFSLKTEGNDAVLTTDAPGVKDGSVTLECGWLKFAAQRSDTKVFVQVQHWLGLDYDPETLKADLEFGVLTVRVTKHATKRGNVVKVIAK